MLNFLKKYIYALVFALALFLPAHAQAANLYFSGSGMGGDTDWANIMNWYTDSGFTSPSMSLPTSADAVFIYTPVGANYSMSNAEAYSAEFRGSGSLGIQFYVTTSASFYDSTSITGMGSLNGTGKFYNSSIHQGVILGNGEFYDTSTNAGNFMGSFCLGPTATNMTMNSPSGVCSSGLYFSSTGMGGNGDWSNSNNWWSDAGFTVPASVPNGMSTEHVTVSSSVTSNSGMTAFAHSITFTGAVALEISLTTQNGAIFEDSSINNATINGDATFKDTTTNNGVISGTACFYPSSTNNGTAGTTTVCRDTKYFNAAANNDWSTLGNWWNDSGFTTHSASLPGVDDQIVVSANINTKSNMMDSTHVYKATFSGSTILTAIAITVDDVAVFNDTSSTAMGAFVIGRAEFNDSAVNGSTVNGTSSFYDISTNNGTVNGNACFDTTATNSGTVTGIVSVCGYIAPRTLYFRGQVDHDWNTLANWYTDAGFLTQAASRPTSIDSVITSVSIESNSGAAVTVQNLTLNGTSSLGINVTVASSTIFNDMSYNQGGTITGNARFNTGYYNNGITATSSVMNFLNTIWAGTVTGTTTGANGDVIQLYVFNGTSTLSLSTTIKGEAQFNDTSVNNGTVTGNGCIGVYATNNGTIQGSNTVCPYPGALTLYHGGMVGTEWSADVAWKVDSGFLGSSPRAPSAIDSIVVSEPIRTNIGTYPTVINAAFNSGGIMSVAFRATGLVIFNTGSFASSTTITGNVMFKNGSESINTTVIGNACFEAGAVNSGTTVIGGSLSVCGVAPIASSIVITPAQSTAVVSWNTNVSASTSIQYGPTTSYGTVSTSTASTSHQVILTGLSPSTTYQYQIISVDVWGNTSISSGGTFTTGASTTVSPGGLSGGGWSSYTTPNITTVTTAPVISTASTVTSYIFTRSLSSNNVHKEVRTLQQFLNAHGFIVSRTGAGSVGKETTVFGPATRAALIRFQKANKITPAVGFFGPITRGVIAGMR